MLHTDTPGPSRVRARQGETPFFAAWWRGEASREGVLRLAPCCRRTPTQAALPLVQELKRGVAPSVDTASTCEGGSGVHMITCATSEAVASVSRYMDPESR